MQGQPARFVSARLLSTLGPRWAHVCGVATAAERIAASSLLQPCVVEAAWLHDIGYSAEVIKTGLHALDGADFLLEQGFSGPVVSLVAYHTGSEYEAEERGLTRELQRFGRPDQDELDALILADLSVSPQGDRVHPHARIAEILDRYSASDPVHRAVTRSREYLLACATRAALATGSPDEWGFAAA